MRSVTKFIRFAASAAVLLIAGCSDSRYDLDKGLDLGVTLFEGEIGLPLGSTEPITVKSTLLGSSIGQMFAGFIKEDELDGALTLESVSEIYAINVHRLEQTAGDVNAPFLWEAGDKYTGIEGIASMLNWLHLHCLAQRVDITATNPLWTVVRMRAQASVECMSPQYEVSFSHPAPIEMDLRRAALEPETIFSCEIPEDVRDVVSSVRLDSLSLRLPATPSAQLYDETAGDVFSFNCVHRCKIGVSEEFSLQQNLLLDSLGLKLGKLRLKKCVASLMVENTLPLSLEIDSIEVVDIDGDGEEKKNGNIAVTGGLIVAGGSLERPGVSEIKLEISAAEGTIPDIDAIRLDFLITGQKGCEGVPLSGRQGLRIKSSSLKISGGITIPEGGIR